METSLYFIAILPTEDLRSSIKELKEDISKEYNTYHALKSPAHITLQRPFKRENSFEELMLRELMLFSKIHNAFKVDLNGYGYFSSKVLFLNVVDHCPFEILHQDLNTLLIEKLEFSDHELSHKIYPHLTLANRDWDSDDFQRAWSKYQSYQFEASFDAHSICLLKHNGLKWEINREFKFRNNIL